MSVSVLKSRMGSAYHNKNPTGSRVQVISRNFFEFFCFFCERNFIFYTERTNLPSRHGVFYPT